MNVKESSSLSIFDSTERNLTEVGGNRKKALQTDQNIYPNG